MMFEQDAALKKISVLSGGEKARVMLGKLLIRPLNLLILDEPSNHLDIEACDAFVAALNHFEGAVVLVTHNEMFLHAIANRLVVFKTDGIEIFEGSYQEFLDKEGWEDEELGPVKKIKPAGLSKKEMKKKKSELITAKSKKLSPVRKEVTKLEDGIEQREEKIKQVNEDLLDASGRQDGSRIQELAKSLAGLESEVDELFERLEEKTDLAETIQKEFDTQLSELERC